MKNGDLGSRIIKLEKNSIGDEQEPIWIIVTHRGMPETTEAQQQAAIEDYKAKHPDWEKKDINVVHLESDGR